MTHQELARIIDDDLVICVGIEPNSHRSHKLFYSKQDRMCFVVIQDTKTATIVTILPIDYHNNICWAISIESQFKAKHQIIGAENINTAQALEKLLSDTSVFRVSGIITDVFGRYIKVIGLGTWPCEPYNSCVESLVKDEKFISSIADRIYLKFDIDNSDSHTLNGISIRLGKRGDPVFFKV